MKKKLIATLLALSLILTLTACGGETEPTDSGNNDITTPTIPNIPDSTPTVDTPNNEDEPQTENLDSASDQTSLLQAFIDEHKNDEFEILEPFISIYSYIRSISVNDNALTQTFVPDLNIKRNALDIWDVIIELFVEQELPQITDDCNALLLMLEEYGIINPTVILELAHPNGTVAVSASYPSGEIFVDKPSEEALPPIIDTPEITTTPPSSNDTPAITTTPTPQPKAGSISINKTTFDLASLEMITITPTGIPIGATYEMIITRASEPHDGGFQYSAEITSTTTPITTGAPTVVGDYEVRLYNQYRTIPNSDDTLVMKVSFTVVGEWEDNERGNA